MPEFAVDRPRRRCDLWVLRLLPGLVGVFSAGLTVFAAGAQETGEGVGGSGSGFVPPELPRTGWRAPVDPPSQSEFEVGPIYELDEVVATPTRALRSNFNTPAMIGVVGDERMVERGTRTVPQALRDVPGVMVQETSTGQGSPFIRGFTGQQTLLMIDGIRMNNSVFRPGPNQYLGTIDAYSLDRVEVLKGPGSVLYGSDAIGGTVNAVTLNPYSYTPEGFGVNGRAHYRVSSGENSHTGRGEVSLGLGETTGFLFGGTGQHFGDVIGGEEVGRQGMTGYDTYAYDFKTEHFLDRDTRLIFAHQRFRMNNAPRTHRTLSAVPFEGSSVGSDRRRDFDQERELTYLRLLAGDVGSEIADNVEATVSYQRQSETQDRVRGSGGRTLDGFDVDTVGFSVQAGVDSPIGLLTYGLEFYHDEVNSFSTDNAIQGPVGDDATYDLLGLYAQTEIDLAERWQLILGGRFTYAAADADSVLDPVGGGRISIADDWSDVVGSAQIIHQLIEDELNVFAGVSQGFRTPNLSDLTRFDSARTDEFEIPSPGLDPEHYVNFEVGTKLRRENLSVELAYFHTLIRDQILRFPTGDTNGSGDSIVTKDNVGDGRVWGLELGAAWRFLPEVTLFGNVAYLEGEVSNFPTATGPLVDEYFSKMMPLTGQVGLRWDASNLPWYVETRVLMADRADKLSSADLGDTSRIPPGGTPGYAVWSVGAGWRPSENLLLNVTLDNLLDEDYRVHGSGQNQPGRQVIFSVTMNF